jgi:hypothetical protein
MYSGETDGSGAAPEFLRERLGAEEVRAENELLRRENRRLAVSLGAYSAFLASHGLLEEAWEHVNQVHDRDAE